MCNHVKGILEYWEEQMEARATMEEVEAQKHARKDESTRRLNAVYDEAALARDSNYEARVAYDLKVEETSKQLSEAEVGLQRVRPACMHALITARAPFPTGRAAARASPVRARRVAR